LEIRKLEILPNGWGVMEDDIIAGLFALVHLSIELVNKEKNIF
jgi:phosphatidylglycerophosphatase A